MASFSSPQDAAGKVYFVRTGADKYVTVRTGFNPLTKKMEAQVANEVVGIPPAGMPEMNKKMYMMVRNGKVNGRQNLASK